MIFRSLFPGVGPGAEDGGGAGFALGPPNNLFGATAGDAFLADPGVTAAANRAAAESTRDTYFGLNPLILAQYDADSSLNIRLFYTDGGDVFVIHQIRQGSAWRNNGSVVGIKGDPGADGTPGTSSDFSAVGADNIPIIGAGPSFAPEASGISVNSDGQFESDKAFRVPGTQVNQAIRLGSGVEELCYLNIHRNTQHHPPLRVADLDGSDRVLNKVWAVAKVTDDVRQAVNTETIVDPTFDLVVSTGGDDGFRIEDFQVNFAIPSSGPKLVVTRNSMTVYEHTFPAFAAGVQRVVLMGSPGSPGFIDVRNGDTYTLSVTNASLLGNVSDVPWYTLTFRNWNEEGMALLSEVGEDNVQSDWNEADTGSDAHILNKPTIPTARTDEEIRDVVAAFLVAGSNVQIVHNDPGDTLTISATGGGGTPPPSPADTIYYGLSDSNNPASVDVGTLTLENNPTSPDTISTGVATAGQYFILLVPQADDISSIFDTVLQQDVTNLFTEIDNVRTISSISYKSYVIGPLNAGVNEEYVINFGS